MYQTIRNSFITVLAIVFLQVAAKDIKNPPVTAIFTGEGWVIYANVYKDGKYVYSTPWAASIVDG